MALGCLVWVVVSFSLSQKGHFAPKANVLNLKGSPYGRTLAYAMRGPADLYWHRGQIEEHGEVDENRDLLGLEADEETLSLASTILQRKKEFDEEEAEHAAEEAAGGEDLPPPENLRERFLQSIEKMRMAYYSRTNEFGDTPQIEAWRFGETEKRLRLSHELDPTNLICYGSYFMFVSEGVSRLKGAGNEEEVIARRQEKALRIALGAYEACLRYPDEPSAVITAASAANDAVYLLANSERAMPGAVEEMQQVFHATLNRYVELRDTMVADGSWDRFSVFRQHEMEEAFSILRVIHLEADGKAKEQRTSSLEDRTDSGF